MKKLIEDSRKKICSSILGLAWILTAKSDSKTDAIFAFMGWVILFINSWWDMSKKRINHLILKYQIWIMTMVQKHVRWLDNLRDKYLTDTKSQLDTM